MNFDLESFMREVHQVAKDKGWWDVPHKTDLECVALMVAEVAEVMEEIRAGKPDLYFNYVPGERFEPTPLKKPEGQASELADVLLRIFDYSEAKKLPLLEALKLKHEYNKTRPYKHGKLK